MKKKQRIGFLLCLIPVFFFTFFGSYALSKKYATEKNDIIYSTKANQDVAVDAVKDEIVRTNTEIVYETYRQGSKIKEETVNAPSNYVGKSRTEIIKLLDKTMDALPREELENGLESMELVSFSGERVVIRKKYGELLPYKYCLYIENGAVTIYYSDKETVYSYTDIQAETLPDSVRKELYGGMEIESQGALYDFLETYSS